MENFREIRDYEGLYQVNSIGQVKSLNKLKGRILRPDIRNGYYSVVLSKENKLMHKNIHRLVAETFLPNPNNLPQVNHIDGDKLNNHISNLEFCTPSENGLHAYRIGLSPKGENHHNSKLTDKDIVEIRRKYFPYKYSMRRLAEEYNVCVATIHETLSNKIHVI
jgi:hypothetical protein